MTALAIIALCIVAAWSTWKIRRWWAEEDAERERRRLAYERLLDRQQEGAIGESLERLTRGRNIPPRAIPRARGEK